MTSTNPCGWERDTMPDGDDVWNTGCGQIQYFSDGDWRENSYKFCPYCGGKIIATDVPVEEFQVSLCGKPSPNGLRLCDLEAGHPGEHRQAFAAWSE